MKTTLMNTVNSEHRARIGAVLCVTALRLTELDREGYNGSGGTAIHQIYKFAYDTFDNTTSIKVGSKTLATYSSGPRNGALTRMTYGNGDYARTQGTVLCVDKKKSNVVF